MGPAEGQCRVRAAAGGRACRRAGTRVCESGRAEQSPYRAAASSAASAGATGRCRRLLGALGGASSLNVSLVPTSKALALDADIGPAPVGATGAARQSGGPPAAWRRAIVRLTNCPGNSWLAAGLGDIGTGAGGGAGGGLGGLQSLLSLASTLGASSSGAGAPLSPSSSQVTLSVKGLIEGLLTPLKVLGANTAQARREFTSWMGAAGVFASGTTVLELKAGVAIDSNARRPRVPLWGARERAQQLRRGSQHGEDPGHRSGGRSEDHGPAGDARDRRRAHERRSGEVRDGPWRTSITAALNPSSTMSGGSAYTAAQSALGEGIEPSLTRRLRDAAEPARRRRPQRRPERGAVCALPARLHHARRRRQEPWRGNRTAAASYWGCSRARAEETISPTRTASLRREEARARVEASSRRGLGPQAGAGSGSGFARAGRFSVSMITRQGRFASR